MRAGVYRNSHPTGLNVLLDSQIDPPRQRSRFILQEDDAAGFRERQSGLDGALIKRKRREHFAVVFFFRADGGGFAEETRAPADREQAGAAASGGFQLLL